MLFKPYYRIYCSFQFQKQEFKRMTEMIELGTTHHDQIKGLLIKTAASLPLLKSREGVKFIQNLFKLDPSYIKDIHASIKTVLPGLSSKTAAIYGEVYLKAWKFGETEFRLKIEDCLQDLMERCIFAKRGSNQVYEPCLALLNKFHSHKNDRKVQAMVCQLYKPILWRNLRSSHFQIRANASGLLFDAFPIEDPDQNLELKSVGLEQQLRTMHDLLHDDYCEVRTVAVAGVCNVMANFWQILSLDEINRMFSVLAKDLCFDSSAFQVRLAVVQGFDLILKTSPMSHAYMKKALPRIARCFFDVKDSVRAAFVDMLLTIKHLKLIQFWDVVSIEEILAQLEVETSSQVCYKIVKLLLNSFFPTDEDNNEETKIERCLYLVKENRPASRKFYRVRTVKKTLNFY